MDIELISEKESLLILNLLRANWKDHVFMERKNQWEFYEGQQVIFKLRMPITIVPPGIADPLKDEGMYYVLVLIRSGTAAIGCFFEGKNIDHKIFRAYMVRKKQGKSQIKHLKTKGKSREGSRIRMAETFRFFENINERLNVYFDAYPIGRIGISCPATLTPYLYNSKEKPPFRKHDARIMKIPTHIANPTYDILNKSNGFLLHGELKYSEDGMEFLENIRGRSNHDKATDEEGDW